MSFTFHPEHVRMRIPGQVPRLDPALDRTLEMPPVFTASDELRAGIPARPILRAKAVAADLGLPAGAEHSITGLVKTLSSSANEIDFRRGMMTHLIEQRYDSTLRRAILQRALSFFRSSRPSSSAVTPTQVVRPESRLPTATPDGRYHMKPHDKVQELERGQTRGGKYHRRVPVERDGKTSFKYVYDEASYRRLPDAHVDGKSAHDEYLRGAVRKLLDKAGDEGCEVEHLRDLVGKHGSKTVAAVLRDLGASHSNGRVKIAKSAPAATEAISKAHVSVHMACFGIEYEEALWKAAAFGLLPLAAYGAGLEKAATLSGGEQEPSGGAGGAGGSSVGGKGSLAGVGAPSPKKLPPGTRRIWHNRIVERGVDDKWHVVGHVAGLEDPGKVPMLEPHEIDPAHLKELIAKLKELIGREKKKHALINSPMPSPKDEGETPSKPPSKPQKPASTPSAKEG